MNRQIHLICNAHLDPVWLWEWQEGAAEAVSTFRTAAELCEQNNTFVFNHNEVILYEWIREYEPSLFERIKKLVKKGRWHIMGGWYLQPDCNMPCGESFVRQILAGRQYFKKHFGAVPKTAINFDPFGHSRGLVQIMAQAGYTAYLFGRPQQHWMPIEDKPFIWEGFAGSQVVARRFIGWYNTALGKSRSQIEERIANSSNKVEAILWGVGNHGGGPSRKDLADINLLIEQRGDAQILHSTPDSYFNAVEKTGESLSRIRTDLNPWAIGCYTSMIRVKQKHRQLENELFMTEKMASCAAANKLMNYPRSEIEDALKDLMFAQFHDILPGSSIQPVEEAGLRLMDHGLEILSRVKMRSFIALAAGQKKAQEGEIPILVYNPHSFKAEQIVECEFNLPDFNNDGSFMDVDVFLDGKLVPVQVEKEVSNVATDWRKRVVFRATLEAGQMNRFDCRLRRLKGKPPVRKKIKGTPFVFKNEHLHVVINPKSGLIDRFSVDGTDYIGKNAFCPVVLEDNEDPWETQMVRFGETIGAFKLLSQKAGIKFSGVKNRSLEPVRVIEDGPVRTVIEAVFGFEESFICQQYKLPKNGTEIEVQTRVFWNHKSKMLKLRIPLTFKTQNYLGQTAYGVHDLPTNGNEAVAQKWVAAISEDGQRAITCINDGTYGSDCSGDFVNLSLLRSPAYSGHPVRDNEEVLMQDRFTQRIDQGERTYTLWINAGRVQTRLDAVQGEALLKNEKPFALSFFPNNNGKMPKPLVLINNASIELSAAKQAQSNADWIIRLFNTTNRKQSALIKMSALNVKCNQSFLPYEIKTLRINSKGVIRNVDLMERAQKS